MSRVKKLIRNRSGNMAIMTAGAIMTLLAASGMAIEYKSMSDLQNELQSQADSAVLRASVSGLKKKRQLKKVARENIPDGIKTKFEWPEDHITIIATQKYEPKFGKILGSKKRRIRACLLYTSPSPRDQRGSRMPSSA